MTSLGRNWKDARAVAGLSAIVFLFPFPVAPAAGSVPDPTVSPQEGEIVVALVAKPDLGPLGYEIFTMNLDGSKRRQITDNDKQEFLPHFSPNGKKLVFTRFIRGSYGAPDAETRVIVYDFAARSETDLGEGYQPVWSPDGSRLAFLCKRFAPWSLCLMNVDGSGAREIGRQSGGETDFLWGDPAWSSDGWILFAVAENRGGNCFKVRLDKIRPDGTDRSQVTDGGPFCTPPGMEQSGDADPGFSSDGRTIFTSRGYPNPPAEGTPAMTERRLVRVSSESWFPGKPETDLSLPSYPSCIEGVPKGSPDGRRVLLFRFCPAQGASGIALTDTRGTFRRFVVDGFGADWHPFADSHADRDSRAVWREYLTSAARVSPVVPSNAALDAEALDSPDGSALTLASVSLGGTPTAAFDVEWTLTDRREAIVSIELRLRASVEGGSTAGALVVLLYNFETRQMEKALARMPAPALLSTQQIELGDLRYVDPVSGRVWARVMASDAAGGPAFRLSVDELSLRVNAVSESPASRMPPDPPARPHQTQSVPNR